MRTRLILELIEVIAMVAQVVPSLRFAFCIFVREHKPEWSATLEKRRLSLMLLVLLAVVALNVGEDVMDGDPHALDLPGLLYLRNIISTATRRFFELVTLTGSWMFRISMTTIAALALCWTRHRYEAALLAVSGIGGALTIYVVKTLAGREHPAIWDTETYWGSSVRSGHTLAVAAIAIAAVLCTMRIRPVLRGVSLTIALSWIALVGISRLVLGVHWPIDVPFAACIGAALLISINSVGNRPLRIGHHLFHLRLESLDDRAFGHIVSRTLRR